MRQSSIFLATLLLCVSGSVLAYGYPIHDRFAATIVGTPLSLAAPLPTQIPVRTLVLPGIKTVPHQFWYEKGLNFSVALQKRRAPLVFLIAGTGAAFDSAKMLALQKALYGAGFHVVNLSSPTHFNFIVNASTTGLPGYLPDDTLDQYRVMEQAWERIRNKAEVSEFVIAGYSLGGIGAAFLAAHDEQAGRFGFRRALMINPPVDLYGSVKLLDGYLDDNLPGLVGDQGLDFLDSVIQRLATGYDPRLGLRLDGDFLFRAYESNQHFADELLANGGNAAAALIGISFRISTGSMLFAGDVMSHSGYLAPANKYFGRSESLEYYAWASARVPFAQYTDELLIPMLLQRYPGKTRGQLLREMSLEGIASYVRASGKVYALTNADEIILVPHDLDYLRAELGERLRVYPFGGHCGNLLYRDNVRDMIALLRGEALPAGDAP